MKVKRLLALIMLVCFVMCAACGNKKATKTSNTGVESTEDMNDSTQDTTNKDSQEGKQDAKDEGSPEENATQEGTSVEDSTAESTSEGQEIMSPESEPTGITTENEHSLNAYEKFLKNETMVYFDRFMPKVDYENNSFELGKGYTLTEVLTTITTQYFEYSDNKKIDSIDYSYIDCGKDGVKELILRFHGMNIYDRDDDSTLVYIMKYIDGKLNLCYEYETWARSESTMNECGYYVSMGSGGASNYVISYGIIDKDGNWKFIATIDMESDINQLTLSEELKQIPVVAETKGITGGIELDTIRFDDINYNECYYTYYVYDDNMELIEDNNLYTDSIYKEIFDEAMVTFYTPDEISAMILAKEEEVGATDEIKDGEDIIWNAFDTSMFFEYVEE